MTDQTDATATRHRGAGSVDERGSLLPDGLQRRRQRLAEKPALDLAYRIGVGVVGTAVLIVGIIMIPYPGPGWLVVFAGLGILATEFTWAHRLLRFARAKYDAFADWLKVQHWSVQLLFGLFTFAVVVATLWLLGALKLAAGWVGIEWSWLASPLF
jgi:uncharacterized protein (TIGR02611 family)